MSAYINADFCIRYLFIIDNGINPPCFATLLEEGLDEDEIQEIGLSDSGVKVLSELLKVYGFMCSNIMLNQWISI